MSSVVVFCKTETKLDRAWELAERLGTQVITDPAGIIDDTLYLNVDETGLSLNCGELSMRGDLTAMLPRMKKGRLQGEMLVKATKLKNLEYSPVAIDATAGLGEDSILLAAAGFNVKLFEYDPVICALLEDSICRALSHPELAPIVSKMEVVPGDSIKAMQELTEPIDVIYLDPMFPARSKSGLIKKKFQLLQQLEQPCSDEHQLLEAAMSVKPKKIVIKRPLKGPYLDNIKPNFSYPGKAIRYDCLINL